MAKLKIKDWAPAEQPRQKLLLKGAEALTDTELLAILINNGAPGKNVMELCRELLSHVHHDLSLLASLSVKDLQKLQIKGLGEAKAIALAAALELGIRRNMAASFRPQVKQSADIAHYLRARLEHRKKEAFAVVCLNNSNKILRFEIVSEGGVTGTVADPRVVLKKALEYDATSIILCHNHPSGNLRPSTADEMLTQKIKAAAACLDIRLLDHIIVSNEGYFSFADEGLLR
jgi:DNA repair protein RadC